MCTIAFLFEWGKPTSMNNESNIEQIEERAMKAIKQVLAIEYEQKWEKWQSQTQRICYEVRATRSTSLPSLHEGFPLST